MYSGKITDNSASSYLTLDADGNPKLDANGKSYDLAAGADMREPDGTVSVLRTMEDLFLKDGCLWDLKEYEEKKTAATFNVLRPLNNICTADGDTADIAAAAADRLNRPITKIMVGGKRDGWHDFDEEYTMYSSHFARTEDSPCGNDPMLMLFTSGTTGYPRIATHSYKYALGHYPTAKHWHNVNPDGLHFTISDTGWGKALWGKIYGQWLGGSAVLAAYRADMPDKTNDELRQLIIEKSMSDDDKLFARYPVLRDKMLALANRIVNEISKMGVKVLHDSVVEVHVSGHACQEEIKLMQALTKPTYYMPVHGEYKHLPANAELARSMGVPADHIFISDIGRVLELSADGAKFAETVPSGKVLVDGSGVGDVGNIVLRDRKHLSQDGLIVVVATVDMHARYVLSGPDIVSRGFVYVRESEDLMEQMRTVAAQAMDKSLSGRDADFYAIKNRVKDDLSKFIYQKTKRRPMILPVIMNV